MEKGQQVPTIGRIVIYHHPVDQKNYPSVISDIRGGPQPDTEINGEMVPGAKDPWVCNLTILRPRAIDWKWCSEGEGDGLWSWPPQVGLPRVWDPPRAGDTLIATVDISDNGASEWTQIKEPEELKSGELTD